MRDELANRGNLDAINIRKNKNISILNSKVYLKREKFEDTKRVIRSCKSEKDIQHNGRKKKVKSTNNDLQTLHIKLKIE